MIRALFQSLTQMFDPSFRRVLGRSLLATTALFAVLWTVLGWVIANTTLFDNGWLEGAADIFGGLLVVALSIVLFPAFIGLAMSFFIDDIADAVEARHYPDAGPGRDQPLAEIAGAATRFTLVLLAINLVALPVYLFVPGVNLLLYYLINGYLLGREYYELVALRHLTAADARALRKNHRGRLFLGGLPAAFLFSLPLINLFAPILAAAMATHQFHQLKRSP